MSSEFIVIYDPLCEGHLQDDEHPESPDRVKVIYHMAEYLSERVSGEVKFELMRNNRKATSEELGLVHLQRMIKKTSKSSFYSRTNRTRIGPDIKVNDKSNQSAESAVGAVLTAVDLVSTNQYQRVFCNIRPPGHHANNCRSSGFCIFNNVAIGVRYAQSKGFKRIAIVDWDVHHGNGTNSIFAKDPDVFFGSIHQSPFYPYTGLKHDPINQKWNYPLPRGTCYKEYKPVFQEMMRKLAEFNPELVFISCGFDAHINDPIGSFNLRSSSYKKLTRMVRKVCNRIISVLEGGYSLDALKYASYYHMKALI